VERRRRDQNEDTIFFISRQTKNVRFSHRYSEQNRLISSHWLTRPLSNVKSSMWNIPVFVKVLLTFAISIFSYSPAGSKVHFTSSVKNFESLLSKKKPTFLWKKWWKWLLVWLLTSPTAWINKFHPHGTSFFSHRFFARNFPSIRSSCKISH